MVIARVIDQDGVMSTIDDAPPLPDLPPLAEQAERLISLDVPQLAGLEEDSLRRAAEQWGGDRNDVLMALSPQSAPGSTLTAVVGGARRGTVPLRPRGGGLWTPRRPGRPSSTCLLATSTWCTVAPMARTSRTARRSRGRRLSPPGTAARSGGLSLSTGCCSSPR